jgi:hypothetical protein
MAKKIANVEDMVTVKGTVKLVNEYQELVMLQKQLKEKSDAIKKEIMELMAKADVTECKAGKYKVSIGTRRNSGTIDKEKLETNYPEVYAECYKAPEKETTLTFTVKAFTVPKGESTTKIFEDILASINREFNMSVANG